MRNKVVSRVISLTGVVLLCLGWGVCRSPLQAAELTNFEDIVLSTKDGLKLQCRYYWGKQDTTTVPIVLLHSWGGAGKDLYPLAESLANPDSHGHAVVVPDLRGHGGSTQRVAADGSLKQISAADLRRNDYDAIVRFDMQAIKKHLREQHNAKRLNIEMLTLVGIEESAIFATEWAAVDWSIAPLPAYKLGQYVKGLVLISPHASFKGMNLQRAINHPEVRSKIAVLIVYGESDPTARNESKRIHTMLKRFHPERFDSDEDRRAKQDLFLQGLDTSLQGTKLLAGAGLKVDEGIANFIELRLLQYADKYKWEPRENPLSD